MEQDKLIGMKQIMAYEKEIETFDERHKLLNSEIRYSKTANALVQACLNGLYLDKQQMTEIRSQVEKPEPEPAEEVPLENQEEVIAEEDGDMPEVQFIDDADVD